MSNLRITPITKKKREQEELRITPILTEEEKRQQAMSQSKVMAPKRSNDQFAMNMTQNNISNQISKNIVNGGMQNSIHDMTMKQAGRTSLDKDIDLSGKSVMGKTTPATKEGLEQTQNSLMSDEELRKKKNELEKELRNYDRKEKVKWWDNDKGLGTNTKNVLYKTFVENQNNKYVEDKDYDYLLKRKNMAEEELENRFVERESQNMNTLDKIDYTFNGNIERSLRGIDSTIYKITGQNVPNNRDSVNMRLADEAIRQSSGAERVGLDILASGSRMLPQMIATGGTGSEAAGLVVGFANYGGDAYNEAKKMGATEEQATKYGLTIGSLEMGLEKLLGGMESIYGKSVMGKTTNKIMNKVVTNPTFRKILTNASGEFTEEYLQEFLEPIVRNIILEEDNGADFWNSENLSEGLKRLSSQLFNRQNLYAGTLGAMTSASMSTPSAISERMSIKNETNNIKKTINNQNVDQNITSLLNKGYDFETSIDIVNKALSEKGMQQIDKNSLMNSVKQSEKVQNNPVEQRNINNNINNQVNENVQNSTARTQNNNKVNPPISTTFLNSAKENNYNSNSEVIRNANSIMLKRGIEGRFDSKFFTNNSENALWRKDENGKRSVIFNPNADENAIFQNVVIHEMVHDVLSSKNSADVLNVEDILDFVSKTSGYESARMNLEETYSKVYDRNSDQFKEMVDEEVIATVLGNKLGSQEYINRLNGQKPNLARRIYNWIVNKLDSLSKVFGHQSEKAYWRDVANRFEKAFNGEYNSDLNDNTKYMMTSVKGMNNGINTDNKNFNTYQKYKNGIEELDNSSFSLKEQVEIARKEFMDSKEKYGFDEKTKELQKKYNKLLTKLNQTENPVQKDTRPQIEKDVDGIVKDLLRTMDQDIIDNQFIDEAIGETKYYKDNYIDETDEDILEELGIDQDEAERRNRELNDEIYDKLMNKLKDEGISIRYDKNGNAIYDRQELAIKGYNELLDYLDDKNINYEVSRSSEAGYVPSIYIKNSDGEVILRIANHKNHNLSDYDIQVDEKYNKLFSDKEYANWKEKIVPKIEENFEKFEWNEELDNSSFFDNDTRVLPELTIKNTEDVTNLKTGYENVSDNLLGFRNNGENKGYYNEKYKYNLGVYVSFDNGKTYFQDSIKGMNKNQAIERAKRNWGDRALIRIFKDNVGYSISNQSQELDDSLFYYENNEDLDNPIIKTTEDVTDFKTGYENVSNNLLGFRNHDENKGYYNEKYKYNLDVYVSVDRGKTYFKDTIKGLNKNQAIERARRNWGENAFIRIPKNDSKYSQKSQTWDEFVENNFKSSGTRTKFSEIKAPINPNAITNQNKVKPPIAKEYQKNTIEEKIETSSIKSISNATKIANKYLDLSREERQSFQEKLKKYENKTYEEIANGKTYNEIKNIIRDYSIRPIENIDEEMKSVKSEIRNRSIRIDDNLKAQITDYNDFRKSMFGKLKLSNKGTSIDSLYNELSNAYPYYFNSNINTEADMLYELADFMNKDVVDIQRYNLSEREIDNCTSKVFNELKNGLITDDKIQEIKDKINNKKYRLTRKEVREQLLSEMNLTPEELSIGDDIKAFNFQITDPIRVNEKIFGRELGKKVNEATIERTKHNEAERTRWLNSERDDIRELGIKPRSKESAAVQKYGEKKYVNKFGETVEYGDKQLIAEFPNVKTQEKIKRAAEMLRNKYDKYIEQINDTITALGYDEIPKRPDYMRHFQELGDIFSQTGVPFNLNDMAAEDLPTDINGLTEFNRPGKNWFASAQKRYGIKTTYDAITGIDGYLEGASNLIFHTEDIQRYRALSGLIRDTFGKTKGFDNLDNLSNEEALKRIDDIQHNKLSKYVAWLDEQANNLAGKKGAIDRGTERMLGRRGYTILNTIKKQVGSNMVGFNVRSAMTNFISSTIAASKTNKIAMVKGTIATINNMFHNDGFINKSDFLTSRFGSDSLSPKLWDKISNAGQILMTGSDYFTSNQIVRSKYYEGLQKGMNETEAIKYADDFGARVMGDRSKGATAEAFNSKTLGFLTQFQLETNNQWQFMVHDTKMDYQKNSKINGGLKAGATVLFQVGQLCAYSYFFNEFFEAITGSRAAFDPIDILLKLFGSDDDDKDKTFEERMQEAGDEMISAIPFTGLFGKNGRMPISDALTPFETTFNYVTGKKNSYGGDVTLEDVKNDTLKTLPYYLLPTGYGQLKKTTKGLSMFSDDKEIKGSYTKSGNLRFPVKDTIGNRIQAGLFGEYASEEARKYFNQGRKPLKKNQENMYETLNIPISDYWVITKDLSALKEKLKGKEKEVRQEKIYEYIDSLDISKVRKDILKKSQYKSYTDADTEILYYIYNSKMSKESKKEILKQLGLDK